MCESGKIQFFAVQSNRSLLSIGMRNGYSSSFIPNRREGFSSPHPHLQSVVIFAQKCKHCENSAKIFLFICSKFVHLNSISFSLLLSLCTIFASQCKCDHTEEEEKNQQSHYFSLFPHSFRCNVNKRAPFIKISLLDFTHRWNCNCNCNFWNFSLRSHTKNSNLNL